MEIWLDKNNDGMSRNSDGIFKVRDSQVRHSVFTSAGYEPGEVELDHGEIAERGYMQSPEDWKNVELTGYMKVNLGDSDEKFPWYARGERHTGSLKDAKAQHTNLTSFTIVE